MSETGSERKRKRKEEIEREREREEELASRFSPLPSVPEKPRVRVSKLIAWRTKISDPKCDLLFDWMFQVIGYLEHSFDVAEVACELLRTYLRNVDTSPNEYQLAAMAAIWIAIKAHQSNAEQGKEGMSIDGLPYRNAGVPSANLMSSLSARAYSATQVINMEASMLKAIDYRIPAPHVAVVIMEEFPTLCCMDLINTYRSVWFVVLVALIKQNYSRSLVLSGLFMIVRNDTCVRLRESLRNHDLPHLVDWFGDVAKTILLKFKED